MSLVNSTGGVRSKGAWERGCLGGEGQILVWVAWVAGVHKVLPWVA